MKYRFVRFALAAAVALALPAVRAQDPAAQLGAKPFTVVAPFPPGGPVDILARMVATGLGEQYKQAAVVDNRPGANGNIGIDLVKRSAPDGHTLLVVPAGNLTINPTLMPNLGYNVEADFAPVSMMARTSNVIAVNPAGRLAGVSEKVSAVDPVFLIPMVNAVGRSAPSKGTERSPWGTIAAATPVVPPRLVKLPDGGGE